MACVAARRVAVEISPNALGAVYRHRGLPSSPLPDARRLCGASSSSLLTVSGRPGRRRYKGVDPGGWRDGGGKVRRRAGAHHDPYTAQPFHERGVGCAAGSRAGQGSALRLDLDLDEHELEIVGVDHVVLDARLAGG
jgi:hypothetical protein